VHRILRPGAGEKRSRLLIELPYSLVIEATDEPDFFGF
jgi:hypothetical protein